MKNTLAFRSNRLGEVTRKTHKGKEYLIAPVIALVEGVVNGEYVAADEIGRHVGAWNGIPIPLGHPIQNGQYISANQPDIPLIGRFYNASVVDDKLKGEMWLDVAKLEAAGADGKDALRRLEQAEVMEVSTAYWRDIEAKPGQYKGADFGGNARNLRPDHLALLLHTTGACSIDDGCGVPRVNEDVTFYKCGKHLDSAAARETGDDGQDDASQQSSVEVQMSIVQQIIDGVRGFLSDGSHQKEIQMNELIKRLLANERIPFDEDALSAMTEEQLQGLEDMLEVEDAEDEDEDDEGDSQDADQEQSNEDVPAWASALSDKIDGVIAEVESLKSNADAVADTERQTLIKTLAANEAVPFSKDDLQTFEFEQLQKIASAYKPADYSGAAGTQERQTEATFELPMPA